MTNYLKRLREWLLIKLAAGRPVAINLKLTRGLYLQYGSNGLYINLDIDHSKEWPIGPDKVGIYLSGDKNEPRKYDTYPGVKP
jgi:hypothetical protein